MKKLLRNGAGAALLLSAMIANGQVATYLPIPNPQNMVEFGYSVVEYNGFSVFGSEFRNAINVFQNGTFKFQAVGPVGSNFGHAVGVNQGWLAAGAYQTGTLQQGSVYLSKHVNGQAQNNFNTIIYAQTPSAYDQFGKTIDLFGDWMVIGAPNVSREQHGGYVEVWKHNNGTWSRNTVIRPANLPINADFGNGVALRNDRLVVGAPGIHKIFIYKHVNNVWTLEQEFSPNIVTWGKAANFGSYTEYYSSFGFDVDITDGYIIVGDPTARKAAILALQNNTWNIAYTLTPPATALNDGDRYAQAVAIQYNRAVVGAPRPAGTGNNHTQGKVYMYSDGYQFKGAMYVGNPSNLEVIALGYDVSIDSDIVLAGASNTNNWNSIRNEGAAFRMPFWYVYQSGNWRTESEGNAVLENSPALFPNPAKGNQVTYQVNGANLLSAEAVNATGETTVLTTMGNQIDLSGLNPGMYFLKMNMEAGVKTEKLIKE